MNSSSTERPSPYKGLIPYAEGDAPFFFGREKETRLISANLFASPLTLLYGASGVGKSSVLRAGVAHQLRQRDDLLVVVFNSWQSNAVSDLKQAIAYDADLADPAAWRKAVSLLPQERPASLSEFLAICATQLNRRLMIILDQFEEYFLYHPQDDEFAVEFPRAVTQTDAPVSFLISIREDSLAKLDRFEGRIPSLFDNYLRIEHLNRDAARDAVLKPIERYNELQAGQKPISIEKALVNTVLAQVQTGQVILGETVGGAINREAGEAQIETPFLQLVMVRLWREEMLAGSRLLRLETLNRLGGAESIVKNHLNEAMDQMSPGEQNVAARVFPHLVTRSRTKIAYPVFDLVDEEGIDRAQLNSVLKKLSAEEEIAGEKKWILRQIPALPGERGGMRYEIFHDVLAAAILDWRSRYVQQQQLAAAQGLADEERQRAEAQAAVARRLRRLVAALVIMFLLAMGTVAYAFAQRGQARAYAEKAEKNAKEALEYARKSEELKKEGERLSERGQMLQAAGAQAKHEAAMAQQQVATERERTKEQIRIADIRKTEADLAQKAAGVAQMKAIVESKRAEEQASASRVAFSNLLSVQSKTLLDNHPQRAALLTVEALHSTQKGDPPTPAAEETLRQSLAQTGGRVFGKWDEEGTQIMGLAVSPDGRWLASASYGKVRLFNLAGPDPNTPARTFEGHSAAFSPDGRWMIVTGKIDAVLLWDMNNSVPDAKPIALEGHGYPWDLVMVSPDSHWLISGGDTGPLRLWDLRSPRQTSTTVDAGTMRPDSDDLPVELITLAISPDSHWLVTSVGEKYDEYPHEGEYTGGKPGKVRLWNLTALDPGAKPFEFAGHKHPVTEAVFSPDGRWLATGSRECDDGVRLWDLKTSNPAAKPMLLGHKGSIGAVTFSPNNRWLVTGSGLIEHCSSDSTARVWDLTATDIAAKPYRIPEQGEIFTVTFTPNSNLLIIISSTGYSTVSSPVDEEGIKGSRGGGETTVHVWNWEGIAKGDVKSENLNLPNTVLRAQRNALNFVVSSDHRWLAATSNNDAIVWDLTTAGNKDNQTSFVLRGHEGALTAIAFSPDNRWLVTGGSDQTARLWDLSSDAFTATPLNLPANAYAFTLLAQSTDHRLLVATTNAQAGEHDDSVEEYRRHSAVALVFDLTASDPSRPLVLNGHKGKIIDAAFSLDNHWLVTSGEDKTARLWDLTAPDPAANPLVFAGHQATISDLAISADKHWLATVSDDGSARLWDLTAADPTAHPFVLDTLKTTFGFDDEIYTKQVSISPDSRWLITSGHRNSFSPARLWDLKSADPSVAPVTLGNITPMGHAFSPDGHWLAMFWLHDDNGNDSRLGDVALLWDLSKKPLPTPSFRIHVPGEYLQSGIFSSDGRWFFTSGSEHVMRWDLTAADPSVASLILNSPLSDEYLKDLYLSPDNRWLVAHSSARGPHVLWDLQAKDPMVGRVLKNPDGYGDSEIAFDPESRWLVTSYEGSTSDLATRTNEQNSFPALKHNLRWDLTAANPAAGPVALPGGKLIRRGAVSADGHWLITGGPRGIELWNMRLDELIDQACRTAGRNLTQDQWKEYFPGQAYRKTCPDLPAEK